MLEAKKHTWAIAGTMSRCIHRWWLFHQPIRAVFFLNCVGVIHWHGDSEKKCESQIGSFRQIVMKINIFETTT